VSLDIEVYTNRPSSLANLLANLPDRASWEDFGAELAFAGDGWQVLISEPEEIELRDVPAHFAALLTDARYLVALTLEPIGAPEEGYSFLERVLESVGSATGGVSNDFHTGAPRRFSG